MSRFRCLRAVPGEAPRGAGLSATLSGGGAEPLTNYGEPTGEQAHGSPGQSVKSTCLPQTGY